MVVLNSECSGSRTKKGYQAVFCSLDISQQKTPLDYARDYNVDGMGTMLTVLCTYRNSWIAVVNVNGEKGTKR